MKLARLLAGALGVVVLAGMSGCVRVPRTRQLPEHIRSVYVPLFKNSSFEPSIEEDITRLVVEKFLSDGRLDVARQREADLVLEGVVTSYRTAPTTFEDDEFPSRSRITIIAKVRAYDPLDYDREFLLGTWEEITTTHEYLSNTRRMLLESDVDAKEMALDRLATEIIMAIINDEPDDLAKIREKKEKEGEEAEARRTQIRFRSAYVSE